MAPSARTAKYSTIRKNLDTGDLVLFSGKGNISQGIKFLTNSKYSHVGMVVKMPEWNKVVLYESTTLSDLADIESGKATKGVQMVFLSDRLRTYDGDVAVRHLSGIQRDENLKKALTDFRHKMRGRKYETSKIQLLKAAHDGWFGKNEEDLSSLFCSELVAEAYQRMGLLSEKLPSNEYTPADFSDERDHRLELQRGKLSKEILVRW